MGPTAFARQQKRQGQNNYYDLSLNSETTRYVFRLIAIKEIMNAPEAFGYYIDNVEKYPPLNNYYNVLVETSINDWSVFAKENGTTLRELKRYNPWIRQDKLTVIINQYQVRIPQN